jgi:hypothetical protein
MADVKFSVYVNPAENVETYPDNLHGDMSIFNGFRNEVQWLFYLHLRERFTNLQISGEYPEEGIFLIHKSNVKSFNWNPDLFVVSAQWDHPRDDRAQVHLVANQYKTTRQSLGKLDRLSGAGYQYCTCPIMHPVVIPRSEARGDRLENIVYMGNPKNLDPAFRTEEFRQQVADLGMNFIIESDPHKHADFSEVDVSFAIRKIGKVINNKPAVKLYNAWRGRVPAVLGCEIGFREVRESEYDFIEVDSVEDVLEALKKLRDDVEFRNRMIENAIERGKPYDTEGQQQRWGDVFESVIMPYYERWRKTPRLSRQWFLFIRWIRYQLRIKGAFFVRTFLKRSEAHYH